MRSSFFEFHVATSGLFTSQANLSVIGHNIANASVKGYSRQQAKQRATVPLGFGDGKGMIGTGSEVYDIAQIREFYLDRKYWDSRSTHGEFAGKAQQLSMMENVISEMGEIGGIANAFDDFFSKATEVSTTANDQTYRTNLTQSADTLVNMIKTQANTLQKYQLDANIELSILVDQINSIGLQVTSLNRQITYIESDGSTANDLRDERANLLDELSEIVNTEVKEVNIPGDDGKSDKRLVVMLNGYDFINHYEVNLLNVKERITKTSPMDIEGLYDVYIAGDNTQFNLYHPSLRGRLKGIADIRDGNGSIRSYKGIPYYMDKFNRMVRTVAKALNEGTRLEDGTTIPGVVGHIYGYNLSGQRGLKDQFGNFPNDRGTLFLTYAGGPLEFTFDAAGTPITTGFYEAINCLNFKVNDVLIEEPGLINAAAPDATIGESAYTILRGFTGIKADSSLFKEGKLLDFVSSMGAEMGIDSAQAKKFDKDYNEVVMENDNHRISVFGVDLNEEMIYMIKNQQIYQAAGRLISTINGIYDFLINRLGA